MQPCGSIRRSFWVHLYLLPLASRPVIKNPQALVFSGMALGFVMLGFALGAALNPDLTGIFAGLVFLVLGEVFRIGAKMQEEQDLTV